MLIAPRQSLYVSHISYFGVVLFIGRGGGGRGGGGRGGGGGFGRGGRGGRGGGRGGKLMYYSVMFFCAQFNLTCSL